MACGESGKQDGTCGEPIAVVFEGGTPRGVGTVAIGPDGNRMVMIAHGVSSDDLFMSTRDRTTGRWSQPQLLGSAERMLNEWHPFITYDGRRLIYDELTRVHRARARLHTFAEC